MLPLPSAATNQYNSNGCILNELIPDALPYDLYLNVPIVYVAIPN